LPRSDPALPSRGAVRVTSTCPPVLVIGAAHAVLLDAVAPSASARIAAAQAALRASFGDDTITIGLRPSGRPRLLPPHPELGVSLSHRGDLVLAGFSRTGATGVDIEIDTPGLEPERLASDHYTPAEAAAIRALPPDAARDLFQRMWVAKEAALKLTGRGMHDGLDEPDLSGHIDALSHGGVVIALDDRARLPALHLAVRRLELPGRSLVYCALAVAVP
jgi:4'-phosphopantetheinyl transferase